MDRYKLLAPVASMMIAAIIGTILLLTTAYVGTHFKSPWLLTLVSLTICAYSFAVGPALAFAGEASALWLSAVLWHRKDPKWRIHSFGELYRHFYFNEPLRVRDPEQQGDT